MKKEKRIRILNRYIKKEQEKAKNTQRYSYLNTKRYGYEKISQYFKGSNVLELGTDGSATSSILVRWSKKLTIVDMEDKFTKQIQEDNKLKKVNFLKSKWEDFKPTKKFSDILLTDSLEHVKDSKKILTLIKGWLKNDGRLHIIVPNALSVHRLIGTQMGYLDNPYQLNENDIKSEHIKVYDYNILKKEVKNAKLSIKAFRGIQLKPNTDNQLLLFGDDYSDALNSLSALFDKNCAELYFCIELIKQPKS